MADNLQYLIAQQGTTFDAIKRTIPNYKKLSKANISLIKTRSRLSDLQKLWEKAHRLHAKIFRRASTEEKRKLPYFTQEEYLVAEEAYYEASDYFHEAMDSLVKPKDPVCDPTIDIAFCAPVDALGTAPEDSRNEEDDHHDVADYPQEAISGFVKPVGPVSDLSTDSTTCDPAGTLGTVTDNLRNNGRSVVNNVSVQNCELSTDTTFRDSATPSDTVNHNSRDKSRSFIRDESVPRCGYCLGLHSLEDCEKFLSLSIEQRSTLARRLQVCVNCLPSGHFASKCPSNLRCLHCCRMHHSLLHLAVSEIAGDQATRTDVSRASDVLRATTRVNPHAAESSCDIPATQHELTDHLLAKDETLKILGLPWLPREDAFGFVIDSSVTAFPTRRSILSFVSCVKVRTLLDQGSTPSFSSKFLCRTLRLTRPCTDLQILRFGKNYTGHTKSKVVFGLIPCNQSKPLFPVTARVRKSFVLYTASVVRPPEWRPHLRGPPLEDSHPTSSQRIHLLLGNDLYETLELSDLCRDLMGTPTAQRTEPGWVIPDPIEAGSSTELQAHVPRCVYERSADSSLRRSWADEKIPAKITKAPVQATGDCHIDILTDRCPLRGRLTLIDRRGFETTAEHSRWDTIINLKN